MSDSTWKDMINSLYEVEAFVEDCYINGFKTKCFVSPLGDGNLYTDAGLQSECNFSLEVKIDDLEFMPKVGDKIEFRDNFYKLSSTERDSANVCLKLYLVSLSKGC